MKWTVSLKLLDPPGEEFAATVEAFQDACQIVSTRLESGELRPNSRTIELATYHDLAFPPATADTGLTLTSWARRTWRGYGWWSKLPRFGAESTAPTGTGRGAVCSNQAAPSPRPKPLS